MHTLYCILGRTSSGKSSITKEAAKKLNMTVLKSYTTRSMRPGETVDNSDHIFISPDDVEKYKPNMVAYTDRVGYCSFATKEQILNSNFYIIDPVGLYTLKLKTRDIDVRLVSIYITTPYTTAEERAKKRGDYDSRKQNYAAENDSFSNFEKSNLIDYRILNDRSLEASVEKMINIIRKDWNKNNVQTRY